MTAYIVPDVPRAISDAIKKEAYIARVALEEALYGADERVVSIFFFECVVCGYACL